MPHRDRGDAVIFEAILSLSKSLNLEVVAEGVEEPKQLAGLKRHGCTLAPGFLLARPMPAHRLEALLEGGRGVRSLVAAVPG